MIKESHESLKFNLIVGWFETSLAFRIASRFRCQHPADEMGEVYLRLRKEFADSPNIADQQTWINTRAPRLLEQILKTEQRKASTIDLSKLQLADTRIDFLEVFDDSAFRRISALELEVQRLPQHLRQPLLVKLGGDLNDHTIAEYSRKQKISESTARDRAKQAERRLRLALSEERNEYAT